MKYTINEVWKSLELYNLINSMREEKEARLELVKDVSDIPKNRVSKLVVASGSYDPLTIAHSSLFFRSLEIAKKLPSRRPGIEQLLILTSINHIHKKSDISKNSSLQERYRMTVDFAEGKPNVAVGMVNRGLFVDFVPLLEQVYGKNVDIYFVCGTDLMQKIADPAFYHNDYTETKKALYDLFSHRFLVSERTVDDKLLGVKETIAKSPFLKPYKNRIIELLFEKNEMFGIKLGDISSTLVRNSVKEGKDFEHFIADTSVVNTIKNLELYGKNNNYQAFVCAIQAFADINRGKKAEEYFGELINYLSLLENDEELRRKTIQFYNTQDLESISNVIRFFRGEKKS
ncbi:hypothetical protein HZA97_08930 [Candidatus Woesearchaeota archaeon]|nr:hypothetical protein [Candidatus Woesearchaeota archaeon]